MGQTYRVADILYLLMITLKPATLEEQDFLTKQLVQPRGCSEPQAALKEYRRWRAAVTRSGEIGMSLPPAEQLYRGVRTIFAAIFENGDFPM